jgi:hypothetical protein
MGEPMMQGRGLQKLGREIAEELDAMRDESAVARAREQLFDRRGAWASPKRSRTPAVAFGLAFAGLAAAAAILVWRRGAEPMAFEVGDPPEVGAAGAWVAAPAQSAVPMRFADGTRFEVEPGSRVRVASSDADDAHLVLESGSVQGEISVRDGEAPWRITAGPFDIVVQSGSFRLGWDPVRGVLDLREVSGRALVTGPHAAEGLAVKRGEYMRVSLWEAKLELSAAPISSSAPASGPPASTAAPQPAP